MAAPPSYRKGGLSLRSRPGGPPLAEESGDCSYEGQVPSSWSSRPIEERKKRKERVESNPERLLVWPHTSPCTDGELDGWHPRGFGAFPRILGRYVRDRGGAAPGGGGGPPVSPLPTLAAVASLWRCASETGGGRRVRRPENGIVGFRTGCPLCRVRCTLKKEAPTGASGEPTRSAVDPLVALRYD